MSPGVILSADDAPMQGVVFDNVVFNNPGEQPWGEEYYHCGGVDAGVALGSTWPVPPCFEDKTDNTLRSREGK